YRSTLSKKSGRLRLPTWARASCTWTSNRITEEDVRAATPKLAEASGIVFDLRGYPRGGGFSVLDHLTAKPVTSGQWHVPVVVGPDRDNMRFSFSNWNVTPVVRRMASPYAAMASLDGSRHHGVGILTYTS